MKKLIFMLISCLVVEVSHAQFLGGLFSQKKTQREYLMQQIAALRVYKGYLEKGYHIAKTGLGTIQSIKTGDYSLHNIFFSSLSQVNPNIKRIAKVAEIISMNKEMLKLCKQLSANQDSEIFNPDEVDFIKTIINRILETVAITIDELSALVSDNQLTLHDDERIERIDALHQVNQRQIGFLKSLTQQIILTSINKHQELKEVKVLEKVYGSNQ